jgi:hypothetical protein
MGEALTYHLALRLNYRLVRITVRRVTDPYLLSANDDAPVPAIPADRAPKPTSSLRRLIAPRPLPEGVPPEILDRVEEFTARAQETWGDLADLIARKLTAAGFQRHDPRGHRGGFALSLWDDGVTVAWSTTEYPEDSVSPFEKTVEQAMHPALEQILRAIGFTGRIIPDGQDNGGSVLVTGWQRPTDTAAQVRPR